MLSTLFPTVSKKCLKLPLFRGVMEDFADWLAQQGYARLHMRATLNVVRKVERYLLRKGIQRVENIPPAALHRYWRTLRRRTPWEAGAVHIVERFLRVRGFLSTCQVATPYCFSSGGVCRIPARCPRIGVFQYRRATTNCRTISRSSAFRQRTGAACDYLLP